ncbi:unnamed protein product [Linum trigynum]|uniref:Uncharacterized protein n=1 Tax=Linum trigynum TaxID=586398 RepID=A0AAV2DFH9_9ROSI
MPPKFDLSQLVDVFLRVIDGEVERLPPLFPRSVRRVTNQLGNGACDFVDGTGTRLQVRTYDAMKEVMEEVVPMKSWDAVIVASEEAVKCDDGDCRYDGRDGEPFGTWEERVTMVIGGLIC